MFGWLPFFAALPRRVVAGISAFWIVSRLGLVGLWWRPGPSWLIEPKNMHVKHNITLSNRLISYLGLSD